MRVADFSLAAFSVVQWKHRLFAGRGSSFDGFRYSLVGETAVLRVAEFFC